MLIDVFAVICLFHNFATNYLRSHRMATEDILEDEFSSDEEFDDDEDSESSTDVDAKLAEDEVFDAEFLKCYAALKKRDEKIYDNNVKFFSDKGQSSQEDKNNLDESEQNDNMGKPKAPKMTLIDHQLALARGEIQLEENTNRNVPKSYYEKELEDIKTSIQKKSEYIDSDSEDDLLVVKGAKEGEALVCSKKKADSLLDKIEDPDVAHLKDLWNNPEQLTEEDKFLRDYIVNKRYLPGNVPTKDGANPFFSENIDELSDVEDEKEEKRKVYQVDDHTDITRVPRNSTKTIRDLVEKQQKKEKRLKRLEKKKKKKRMLKDADYEDIIDDLPIKFHYQETEPQDNGLTAEQLLMASDDEDMDVHPSKSKKLKKKQKHAPDQQKVDDSTSNPSETKSGKRKKKHKRGLNHKKFAKVGVAPDRLLAYGLSKNKLKKSNLI